MSAIDWTTLYKKYQGLWVALKDDERTVVSAHKIARKAFEEAKQKGYEHPIMTRVPEDLQAFAGSL